MKTISTNSGHIINLDHIAMITVDGRYSHQPVEESTLTIHFSATFSLAQGSRSMRLNLSRDEAKDFLKKLEAFDVDTKQTLKALEDKLLEDK